MPGELEVMNPANTQPLPADVATATGPILWFLRTFGFVAWTSLCGVIYVLPGREHDAALLRHERTHLAQMRRDGKALFALRYGWWCVRYGYRANPYEVEARAAEFSTGA